MEEISLPTGSQELTEWSHFKVGQRVERTAASLQNLKTGYKTEIIAIYQAKGLKKANLVLRDSSGKIRYYCGPASWKPVPSTIYPPAGSAFWPEEEFDMFKKGGTVYRIGDTVNGFSKGNKYEILEVFKELKSGDVKLALRNDHGKLFRHCNVDFFEKYINKNTVASIPTPPPPSQNPFDDRPKPMPTPSYDMHDFSERGSTLVTSPLCEEISPRTIHTIPFEHLEDKGLPIDMHTAKKTARALRKRMEENEKQVQWRHPRSRSHAIPATEHNTRYEVYRDLGKGFLELDKHFKNAEEHTMKDEFTIKVNGKEIEVCRNKAAACLTPKTDWQKRKPYTVNCFGPTGMRMETFHVRNKKAAERKQNDFLQDAKAGSKATISKEISASKRADSPLVKA